MFEIHQRRRSPMAQANRNLGTLQRRLKHLEGRVQGRTKNALSFHRAEIIALRWAIEELTEKWAGDCSVELPNQALQRFPWEGFCEQA
jgi:hypothetical protein